MRPLLSIFCLAAVFAAACAPKNAAIHAGNLIEIGGAGATVDVAVSGLESGTYRLTLPTLNFSGHTMAVVPLMPMPPSGALRMTFTPKDAAARTVDVVALKASGKPGDATIAFVDRLRAIDEVWSPSKDAARADTYRHLLDTLGPVADHARDTFVQAQSAPVQIGRVSGEYVTLDQKGLALLDGVVVGSKEAPILIKGKAAALGAGAEDVGLSVIAVSMATGWLPPASPTRTLPAIVAAVAAPLLAVGVVAALSAGIYAYSDEEQREKLKDAWEKDQAAVWKWLQSQLDTIKFMIGGPDANRASDIVTDASAPTPSWQLVNCVPKGLDCGAGDYCCAGTTCKNGWCRPDACGDDQGLIDQACCAGDVCLGGNCYNAVCSACGVAGWPCCGDACYGASVCQSGDCLLCGGDGQPCCSGGTCSGQNVCTSDTCHCQPATCDDRGAFCGVIDDGCGAPVFCPGTCPGGTVCNGSNQCEACGEIGQLCCEGDSCASPLTCGGGGTAGKCGCTPTLNCTQAGVSCGSYVDDCGNTLNCGPCDPGASCTSCCGQGCCDTIYGTACGPDCVNMAPGSTFADCESYAMGLTSWPGCGGTFWVVSGSLYCQ